MILIMKSLVWLFDCLVRQLTSLEDIFLLVGLDPRGKNRRAPKIADDSGQIVALHDGKPTNIAVQHFRERRVQRFVRKRDCEIGAGAEIRQFIFNGCDIPGSFAI